MDQLSPVTALFDRLLHHAVVFQIEGSSYRLREHAIQTDSKECLSENSL